MTTNLAERPVRAPHDVIGTLTNAYVASRCLHVVAALGVADLIEAEPVPIGALATQCGADASSLDRVLELLAAHDVFQPSPRGWIHTPASLLLRSDHPMSMRAFPRMNGLPALVQTFERLEHSVRTGEPAMNLVTRGGLWSHLATHPEEQDVFAAAMQAYKNADVVAMLQAYDFTGARRVVDIGGGRGHFVHAIVERYEAAEGVVFDLPDVVEAGGPSHPRLTRVAGDFFHDPLPVGDIYLLGEILHDWPDPEAISILRGVRGAAPDDARVLIVENVLHDDRPDGRSRTLDVIMLAVTGGRERTPAQFDDLLAAAGLVRTRVVDTATPMRIVEAVPIC